MAILYSAILVAIVAVLIFKYLTRKKLAKPYPPGPRGWELVKALYNITKGSLPLHVEDWAKKYGDVVYLPNALGGMLFMTNPSTVKELFAGKATEKYTNDRMSSYAADVLCRRKCLALSNPSDPNWIKMRKLMHSNLKFYGEGIERFEGLVTDNLDKLVTQLDNTAGQNIVMREVIEDMITNLIGMLLTGEPQEKEMPVPLAMHQFNEAIRQLADSNFSFAIKMFPFLDRIPGTSYHLRRTRMDKAKEQVKSVILMDTKKSRVPDLPRGIVDHLLEYQSKEGADWMTDDHVIGNIIDIIAAGVNTSTQSICSILLYLLHYQDAMRRIQQEVDRVIGHNRKPCVKDIGECPYTVALILEVLRLDSVLPLGLDHYVNQNVEINGYAVPKGSVAFSAVYALHRSKEFWNDPLSFQPERFLDEEGHLLPVTHPTRQSLLSFGTGKRACPGEKFARARMFLFVTTLMLNFDLLPPTNEKLLPLGKESWDFSLVSILKNYQCRFRRRQL